MKIRCSRCGKRFDADVYSGLCPKCGAYNGKHMAGYEEAVNEREKTEKTWRQEQQKAEMWNPRFIRRCSGWSSFRRMRCRRDGIWKESV